MKCESCKIREAQIEMPKNEGLEYGIWDAYEVGSSYQLCMECCERLKNYALRPLEVFNLVAIHGHVFYLHDDFYDYETGEAFQPHIEINDADMYPFPLFEEIKNNPNALIDYVFVQYFTEDEVIEQLEKFDKQLLLEIIKEKVDYDSILKPKAYEIISKAIGSYAKSWAEEQWTNRKTNCVFYYAELLSCCLDPDMAFEIITKELEQYDNNQFNTNISALLYLKSEKTLDWLENQTKRISNVTSDYGQLAASSEFSWQCCDKWLKIGRPLSLIALDALYLCTLQDYVGQSIWLQKLKPRLIGSIHKETLYSYLECDHVPRTRNVIERILSNLYEIK